MENNYYQKYLKYKSKYLELKKQLGGADDKHCYNYDKTPTHKGCLKCCEDRHKEFISFPELYESQIEGCVNLCDNKLNDYTRLLKYLDLPLDKCESFCKNNVQPENIDGCKQNCKYYDENRTVDTCIISNENNDNCKKCCNEKYSDDKTKTKVCRTSCFNTYGNPSQEVK